MSREDAIHARYPDREISTSQKFLALTRLCQKLQCDATVTLVHNSKHGTTAVIVIAVEGNKTLCLEWKGPRTKSLQKLREYFESTTFWKRETWLPKIEDIDVVMIFSNIWSSPS